MALKLNPEGLAHAKRLIGEGKIDFASKWSNGQPSAAQGDSYIKAHSMDEYAKWFLGNNTDANKDTKAHYEFPYGDFSKIYREGVITIEHRAGQYKHPEIELAAKQLLELIDKKK